MGEKFLRNIAKKYAQEEEQKLSSTIFVFPNKRSSLFFKKYLSEEFEHPIFSPKILTISELFNSLYDVRVAEHLVLLSVLWEEWNVVMKKSGHFSGAEESLDDFFYWGDLLLTDFSHVDSYLVDAKQIFTNTADYKNITYDLSWMTLEQKEVTKRITNIKDFWFESLQNTQGDYKQKFINYWNVLYDLYIAFRQELQNRNICYAAMQYRAVAQAIIDEREGRQLSSSQKKIIENLEEIEHISFIGFSAPTNCEKEVMKYFSHGGKNRKGSFYWDYFSDWIRNTENKSALLMKGCIEEFGNDYPLKDKETEEIRAPKEINAYSVKGTTQQTLVANLLLSQIHNTDVEGINTAVVVSDENLLIPLLAAIPECYTNEDGSPNVNITMGYPFSATPVYALLRSLMRFISTIALKKRDDVEEACCETNALMKLLSCNYLEKDEKVAQLLNKLSNTKNFHTFFSEITIPSLFPSQTIIDSLAANKQDEALMGNVIEYYIEFFTFIEKYVTSFERSYIYSLINALSSIKALGLKITRLRTLNSLIASAARNIKLNFSGEPLKGLQIMGPLETRLLDFDNLLFLSFNDAVFPASGEQKSAIPYTLRASFGLPTYEKQDSISAYNFYRLAQRAKRLYCIYDTDNSGLGGLKEESRFLKQLKYSFNQNVNYFSPDFKYISQGMERKGEFPKKEEDLEKHKSYSASSLNTFFSCPLKFYILHILKLQDEEELDDLLDSSDFGNIFHESMRKIYEPFINKTVSERNIEQILNNPERTDKIIEIAFRKVLGVNEIDRENIIIKSLIRKYIKETLKRDLERVKENGMFTYLGGEEKLSISLWGYEFKAFIDRLDITEGKLLISDYKTGKPKELKDFSKKTFDDILGSIFDYSGNREPFYAYLFQLMLYALIVNEKKEELKTDFPNGLQVALYQIQKVNSADGFKPYDITQENLEEFKNRLEDLMKRINSMEQGVWNRNIDTSACTYCDIMNKYCIRK